MSPWDKLRHLAHSTSGSAFEAIAVVLWRMPPEDWRLGLDYVKDHWRARVRSGVVKVNGGWSVNQLRFGADAGPGYPYVVNIGRPRRSDSMILRQQHRLRVLTGLEFSWHWYDRTIAKNPAAPWGDYKGTPFYNRYDVDGFVTEFTFDGASMSEKWR